MRLVFMGTPDFAVETLKALIGAGHDIACVYCQPPRPAGRGKKPRPSPVQLAAEAAGLPVRHPPSLRDTAALTHSREAQKLFRAGDRAARREVAAFDTGAWSLYSLGCNESDLGYHRLVRDFLARL